MRVCSPRESFSSYSSGVCIFVADDENSKVPLFNEM
jgi:hypothetical protein